MSQSQQLQLLTEQRLTEEHQKVIELSEIQKIKEENQKGFLARLFNK